MASAQGPGSAPQQAAAPEKVRVLVQFEVQPGPAERALIEGLGGKVDLEFKIVPAVSATLPAAAVDGLRRSPRVRIVEPDIEVQAHEINNTWGVRRIGADPVHTGTFAAGAPAILGTGVRVAVLDSGIDYNHPDLADVYAGGYDYVNNDADPLDDQGHGTHVSGTVAALRNGVGVVGVAPDVDLYALKVLGADGSGSYSWIISALDWCLANNVKVANLSLGSAGHPGSTVETAFSNANNAGLVIVSSAGNAGLGDDTVGYPARFDSVIAVAATTTSDTRANFSSTGPAVEIAAPGASIYSTIRGGGYGNMSGTSMAAPHVAGVAALIIAAGIEDANANGKINDEVRLALQMTAEDLGTAGRDQHFGHGLADAEMAVLMTYNPGTTPDPEPEPEPVPVFNAPGNLLGSSSGSTVTLQWADSSNVEDGFQIQIGAKSRGQTTWADWATVAANSTSFSDTLGDGTYQFRVRAFRSSPSGVTGWSNQIEVKVGASGGGGPKKRSF